MSFEAQMYPTGLKTQAYFCIAGHKWDGACRPSSKPAAEHHNFCAKDEPVYRRGREEALEAGRVLKSLDYSFDCAFTSLLK